MFLLCVRFIYNICYNLLVGDTVPDDVLDKLIEVCERLTRIEERQKQMEEIEKKIHDHTAKMNDELGDCFEQVKACQERLTKIENKKSVIDVIHKLSKWDLAKIGGIFSFLYILIKIIMLVVFHIPMG